jgi:hypothetical protein
MRASVPLDNTNLTVLLNLFLSFFCFYLLSVCTLAANVFGIADGGDFQHKSSIEERKLNLAQMPNRSRSAPLLAIPCWR